MVEFDEYQELGLSLNEGKAYECLVEFGKLGAGEVSQKSGVSYSRIYTVLDALVGKGLVEVVPEKTKKYVPRSPESLLPLIVRKEAILERARKKLDEMKRFYDIKGKNPVVMDFGKKGFHKILKEIKEPQKNFYTIKWTSEFHPEWVRNVESALKRRVDVKTLARVDVETKKNILEWQKLHKNIRKFSNDGFACAIIDDEEVMLGLIKSNSTLLIRDKAFAEVMGRLFKEAYKNADVIE